MKPCTPEEVGLSAPRLERISPAMQTFLNARQAPGFQLAIQRRGRLAYLDCLGWQDAEAGTPLQEDTIYRIYSMTKPIATSALMMLVEEGRMLLNMPVSYYIPGFKDLKVLAGPPDAPGDPIRLEPLQREITVLDLALHTAGLGYGLFTDSPVEDLYRADGFLRYDKLCFTVPLAEAIDRILQLPLANQPGQRWRYSVAIDVIGRLVELVSGRPFDVFLKERIFDPLGMVDTGFFVSADKLGRMATLYMPGPDNLIASIDRPDDSPFTNPLATSSGGGGLLSTIADYLRFTQAMLNGGELDGTRILGLRAVQRMMTNHLPAGLLPINVNGMDILGNGFGPGFGVMMEPTLTGSPQSPGTFYWLGAASTMFFIDPREQLIAVLMTQVINNMVPFGEVFTELVYQAIVE